MVVGMVPAMEADMWGSWLRYVDNQQAKNSDKKAEVGARERAQWVKAYLSSEHLAWLKRWEKNKETTCQTAPNITEVELSYNP